MSTPPPTAPTEPPPMPPAMGAGGLGMSRWVTPAAGDMPEGGGGGARAAAADVW